MEILFEILLQKGEKREKKVKMEKQNGGRDRVGEKEGVKDECQSIFEYIQHIFYFHFSMNIYSRLGCSIL